LENLIPDEDTERAMYEMTASMLGEFGYERYEVSNYAKTGKECKHNILYWRRGDYIGFGLGASSCLSDVRFKNTDSMEGYATCPWREIEEREEVEYLSLEEQMAEEMILGLRMTRGVSKNSFFQKYGITIEEQYGTIIEKYKKEGLLIEEKEWISFTKKGFDLSNLVLCEFI
jgi:oxygen-independent coproporphyrinogen-3 oxidase